MPYVDRGHKWIGYYLADSSSNLSVYGATWVNWQLAGEADGRSVYSVIMYQELLNDTTSAKESFDYDPENADNLLSFIDVDYDENRNMINVLINTDTFIPSVVYLIEQDRASGLTDYEILFKRLGVMSPQFLGFTYEELEEQGLIQYTEIIGEDGETVNVPNIKRITWL